MEGEGDPQFLSQARDARFPKVNKKAFEHYIADNMDEHVAIVPGHDIN